jgi:large repetitive protein
VISSALQNEHQSLVDVINESEGPRAMLKQAVVALALLAAGAEVQAAQRLGPPFQVNNSAVSGYPEGTNVTALRPSGFVVTWLSEAAEPSIKELYAQIYNNQGTPIGGNFKIDTPLVQNYPAAAAGLADGSFVVVWQRFNATNNRLYLVGRRFDGTGAPLSARFFIAAEKTGQLFASIAALQSGGFVVTWNKHANDFSGDTDIYGQRFDAMAERVGSPFRANSERAGTRLFSKVAALQNGGFLAVWPALMPNRRGIFGQLFDAQGAPAGGEFQISDRGDLLPPALAAMRNGSLIAAWYTRAGIMAQRFKPDGSRAGSVFTLKSQGGLGAVAGLANGGFVLTWKTSAGLFVQTFDAMATPTSGKLGVNNSAGQHSGSYPDVAGVSNGHFVVTWTDYQRTGSTAETLGYFGQRYSP